MRPVLLVLSLLTGLLALPATAAAAGSCALTTAASPSHVITVAGTGFSASTVVDVTQTWSGSNATAGGNTGPQTTTSKVSADGSGGFTFTIDAGPGRGGTYDITATSGGCTATAQAVAVETAGGINHGPTATPPATDTTPLADQGAPHPLPPLVPVLLVAALLGLALGMRNAREPRRQNRL